MLLLSLGILSGPSKGPKPYCPGSQPTFSSVGTVLLSPLPSVLWGPQHLDPASATTLMLQHPGTWVPARPSAAHLVDFLPAILVRDAQLGPVVQKQLAASGIAPHHSRVEQRGQPTAVLVVGGAPEVQECLRRERDDQRQSHKNWLVLKVGRRVLGDPHQPVPDTPLP